MKFRVNVEHMIKMIDAEPPDAFDVAIGPRLPPKSVANLTSEQTHLLCQYHDAKIALERLSVGARRQNITWLAIEVLEMSEALGETVAKAFDKPGSP